MSLIKSTFLSALLAIAMVTGSTAATVNVTLDFRDSSNATVAAGSFSYDSSLNGGVIGFGNLVSFDLDVGPFDYDMAFLQSGGFDPVLCHGIRHLDAKLQ